MMDEWRWVRAGVFRRAEPSQVLAGRWMDRCLKYTCKMGSTWRAPQLKVWPSNLGGLFCWLCWLVRGGCEPTGPALSYPAVRSIATPRSGIGCTRGLGPNLHSQSSIGHGRGRICHRHTAPLTVCFLVFLSCCHCRICRIASPFPVLDHDDRYSKSSTRVRYTNFEELSAILYVFCACQSLDYGGAGSFQFHDPNPESLTIFSQSP